VESKAVSDTNMLIVGLYMKKILLLCFFVLLSSGVQAETAEVTESGVDKPIAKIDDPGWQDIHANSQMSEHAKSPEAMGLVIAMQIEKRDAGWQDMSATLQMILRNAQGQESVRDNRMKSLEVEDDGDKTLIVFDSPQDIKGTAFLTYSHSLDADEQWMYLPALKRVKRISSANKSGPFLGSEFAYEDIASQEVDKYRHVYLRDDVLEGRKVFVKERYPEYKHSGYTRQIVWVDQLMYQPLKIEFYDRKNSLLKTLTYQDYNQYLQKFWRPSLMVMVNHQTGKSTRLSWDAYEFQIGLSQRDFDSNSLKRAR